MAIVGGMGVGLVMGWTAGHVTARTARPAVAIPATAAAIFLAGTGVGLLSSADAFVAYTAGALVALGLSIAWLRWLQARAAR
jgi:hypothetical protein